MSMISSFHFISDLWYVDSFELALDWNGLFLSFLYKKYKFKFLNIMLRFYPFKNVKNMSSQIVFNFKSISLLFTQFRVPASLTKQLASIVIVLYTSFLCTFNRCLFKPQLFSSHATCLHPRLTEFLLNCRCLLCLAFYIAW